MSCKKYQFSNISPKVYEAVQEKLDDGDLRLISICGCHFARLSRFLSVATVHKWSCDDLLHSSSFLLLFSSTSSDGLKNNFPRRVIIAHESVVSHHVVVFLKEMPKHEIADLEKISVENLTALTSR